ncbi:MAG: hypothetical protein Q8K46_02225 [Deltaproteobacteria bacterium]|nr:hypothetical protein [Deltaproteobacteria bacterium]
MKEDITEKLKLIIDAAGRIKTGSVTHINVLHDDTCPTLQTGNFADCTCTPEIERIVKQ